MGLLNILQPSVTDHRSMAAIQGTVRADRRTKNLLKRLKPGDIAVIHHADLDATAARALVDARVAAVVNAAPSITGRYPNGGPMVLLEAGIPVVDRVGDVFFERALRGEGGGAVIREETLRLDDGSCGTGVRLTEEVVAEQLEAARGNLSAELEHFARNTLRYLSEEKSILLDPVDLPELATPIRGRHVLIVVRGEGYKDDLRAIADYLHDVRPVLVGVDGGADALIEEGFRPDIIIGDMDSVSDDALKCGAELVVHGYARGPRDAPGLERLRSLGVDGKVFHAPGTSEDIAILLADERGASLIVAVGTHFSLVEFLDKGRGGMASTFLTRLRTGSKLVDAKGIGRLWEARLKSRNRTATTEIILLILAALFPLGVIAVYSPMARTLLSTLRLYLRSTFGMR
jgi:uncharacterized membrane-anchored protein